MTDVRLTRQITLSQPQQRQQQPPIPTLTEKTQRWELRTLNPKPHILKKSGVDFSRRNINGNFTRKPTPDSTGAFWTQRAPRWQWTPNSTWQDSSGSNNLSSNGHIFFAGCCLGWSRAERPSVSWTKVLETPCLQQLKEMLNIKFLQDELFTSSEKHMQQCTTTVISVKTSFQPHSTHQIGAKDQNRNTAACYTTACSLLVSTMYNVFSTRFFELVDKALELQLWKLRCWQFVAEWSSLAGLLEFLALQVLLERRQGCCLAASKPATKR